MCRRGPQNSNDCPLKGSVQNKYLASDRHRPDEACPMFKMLSDKQVRNRHKREDRENPAPVYVQETLL